MKATTLSAAAVIAALVGVAPFINYIGFNPRDLINISYGILLLSIIVSLRGAGVFSYAFWFTLISAYPLLSPLIVQDILEYDYFSYFARWMQTEIRLAEPIFVGALATLFLSLSISTKPIIANFNTSFKNNTPAPGTIIFVLSCGLVLFFAWLTEPGQVIGIVDNTTKRQQQFGGARFAGGAWVLFVVLSTAFYFQLTNSKSKFHGFIYWASIIVSFLWLFAHARRSEPMGVAVFLFCLIPMRKSVHVNFVSSLTKPRVFILGLIVLSFTAIGYFRGSLDWSSLEREDYVSTPGGGSANLLTFIAAYIYRNTGDLHFYPGETYLNLLINLPPEAFGFPRAPDTYDLISNIIDLMGGENWLMEPYMNAGIIGIVVYAMLLAFLANQSVKSIRRFFIGGSTIHAFLQSGTFLACAYRTMWYGPATAINCAIMALIVGLAIDFSRILRRGRRAAHQSVEWALKEVVGSGDRTAINTRTSSRIG